MTAQVVVGTVGNAPQLAPAGAEGELVLDVGGRPGIEGQLRRLVVTQPQVILPRCPGSVSQCLQKSFQ